MPQFKPRPKNCKQGARLVANSKERLHLRDAIAQSLTYLDRALERVEMDATYREVGRVVKVSAGVITSDGPSGVKSMELLEIGRERRRGLAFDVSSAKVGIVLLDEVEGIAAGDSVRRTGEVLQVPVGESAVGRIIDPLGLPLDGKGPVRSAQRLPVERPAPAILERAPVEVPLQTGLKVVDALIPVGRGQRELILGDRQTGKTAVALDAILNQKETGVVCIYCGVGKRVSAVARVVRDLERSGAMEYTAVILASEEDPPGRQFVAPYAAMSIAEYTMSRGKDALVVFDDLTRHARAYRELSLLLGRPPGREAYPGDIFYLHSRLLERSTRLRDELGGGSVTALPIIETEEQNISAYIPTNLISITDGQIYLSPDLFRKGILPAVDVGRSVSRVGGKTQLPAYRRVAGDLRLAYSQFEELEAFSRFGTRLDEDTRRTLDRGRRVREILKQPRRQPITAAEQVAVLHAVNEGALDDLPLDDIAKAETAIRERIRKELPEIMQSIEAAENLSDEDAEAIRKEAAKAVNETFGYGG